MAKDTRKSALVVGSGTHLFNKGPVSCQVKQTF